MMFADFINQAVLESKAKLLARGADKTWWDMRIAYDQVALHEMHKQNNLQQAIDHIMVETYDLCTTTGKVTPIRRNRP